MSKERRDANRASRKASARSQAVYDNQVRRGDASEKANRRLAKTERDIDTSLKGAGRLHKWALGDKKNKK